MKRLSELLDREVVTESGERLGRVFDVRARREGTSLDATELLVGVQGLRERFGVGRAKGAGVVRWDKVLRFYGGEIVVSDDAGSGGG